MTGDSADDGDAGASSADPDLVLPARVSRRRRIVLRLAVIGVGLAWWATQAVGAGLTTLAIEGCGTPSPAAHGTGHDAEWLGHAWVDGRKTQADVDALAGQLRKTGIRDLFIHAGPFRDDGTLDPALRPQARWLTQSLHAALPGVRVQAWLGAHPLPDELDLSSATTRASIVSSVGQVLDDGFDGVHYDFEPVRDGDPDLLTLLDASHAYTRGRHAVLSISAIHTEPAPGIAPTLAALPWQLGLWSGEYLQQVARRVDQVAVMAYDTGLWTQTTYSGYVRRATATALAAVPSDVELFIGVPAYHDQRFTHHQHAETVSAALRGIRLALGAHPPGRDFGVAMYVDFAATPSDWSSYHNEWANVRGDTPQPR